MTVEGLLEIVQGNHSVLEGLTFRPIEFALKIVSKAQVPLTLEGFNVCIKYDGLPVQVIQWRRGDEFASNGLEPVAHDLEPLDTVHLGLRYNPVISRVGLPPKPDRWAMDGYIRLSEQNGQLTTKHFELWGIALKDSNWEYHCREFDRIVKAALE